MTLTDILSCLLLKLLKSTEVDLTLGSQEPAEPALLVFSSAAADWMSCSETGVWPVEMIVLAFLQPHRPNFETW